MSGQVIRTVEEFIDAVRTESSSWPTEQPRWFRGEPRSGTALVPRLYRSQFAARENQLLQTFRARASGFAGQVPDREKTDQWLFLAQHVGLPTRLLDWSEGALIGLYFALKEDEPVVWMLNPLQLNHFARGAPHGEDPNALREFPLPWVRPELPNINVAYENIRGAWEHDEPGVPLPVAVHPTYVHGRLPAQHGCFTVQGKRTDGLHRLVPGSILKRYEVEPGCRASMLKDVLALGITESVVFPDLDGLARELKTRFS